MLQHAIFTIPNRAEGYTTDDNARALIFTVLLNQLGGEETAMPAAAEAANPDWAFRYLAFLEHAFNPKKKRFRNFLGYDRRWLEEQGSEDSHGRALVGSWNRPGPIGRILDCGAPRGGCSSTRCRRWSSSTVLVPAPTPCLESRNTSIRTPGDRDAQRVRFALAQRLLDMYESIQRPGLEVVRECCGVRECQAASGLAAGGIGLRRMNACFPPARFAGLAHGNAALPDERPLCARSARKGFIARAENRPDSINSRLKPPAQCRLVYRRIA